MSSDEDMDFLNGSTSFDEAADWHTRLYSGRFTDKDRSEFDAWLADPENAANYAEFERVWSFVPTALQQSPEFADAQPAEALSPVVKASPRYVARNLALAASLAITIGLAIQYYQVWRFDVVATGHQVAATSLSDGSQVILAPGTAIRTDFTGDVRHVELGRGEAYFDVVHDPQKPFVIDAGSGQVRVLGTAFSVMRNSDTGEVVVQRGRVRVEAGGKQVDLTPGQHVTFTSDDEGAVTSVDVAEAMSWTEGRLVFHDRPLGEVLKAAGPYYQGRIIVMNAEVANRRIDAAIDVRDIDGWLLALNRTQQLRVRRILGFTLIG
jgi:transmembrane sensor